MVFGTDNADISIHTPTQGVTDFLYGEFLVQFYFNPHSHAGSDVDYVAKVAVHNISIHTPTQGVTHRCKL